MPEWRGGPADLFAAQRLQQSRHVRQSVDRAPVSVSAGRRPKVFHVARGRRRPHHHRQEPTVQGKTTTTTTTTKQWERWVPKVGGS